MVLVCIRTGPSYIMSFICDRVSQHFSCMPFEVNLCIPLDLFMAVFIGLVFRNDVTSMQSIIAYQKHVSLLTIEQYPMVNLSAN